MAIYALSSGPGTSGVAVIRVSGKETSDVIRLLTGKEPPEPRKACLRKVNKINTFIVVNQSHWPYFDFFCQLTVFYSEFLMLNDHNF